jgi:hypothetical protein
MEIRAVPADRKRLGPEIRDRKNVDIGSIRANKTLGIPEVM